MSERLSQVCRSSKTVLIKHLTLHFGVGIAISVAYFDPGNWSVDLQAGSAFGYRPMLFVILVSGIGAIVLQTLASKLGCVTGIDLASHCRLLLHDHPKYPRLVRWGVLYPLYCLSEIAILSTDLAELLGSAIGLCLVFPKLPLWGGVVLTATDIFVFLIFSSPTQKAPARMFEAVIIVLVFAVFCCFAVLLVKVHPRWPQVFLGYIPSRTLFDSRAIYSAVGILGATVMPHALFLGSFLATQNRMETPGTTIRTRASLKTRIKELFLPTRADRLAEARDYRNKYGSRENNSLHFIQKHLRHGIVDIVTSLLFVAVPINSAILIVAATVYFHDNDWDDASAGLFDAHDLIEDHVGKSAAMLFAVSLICAGQTAGITATLAGQIVSEGFIEWKVSPFLRRMITRMISLVPAVVVAVSVGPSGINTLLVASQVALSICLPFIAFPLIYLTSSKIVMQVRKPQPPEMVERHGSTTGRVTVSLVNETGDFIDYSNSPTLTVCSSVVGLLVLMANAYAVIMLASGRD